MLFNNSEQADLAVKRSRLIGEKNRWKNTPQFYIDNSIG